MSTTTMTNEKVKTFQREFASHVVWDPAEEGLEPHVEINRTKAIHVVKRYLMELGLEKEFSDKGKDTLYKSLTGFYFGELVMLMAGTITPQDLLEVMDKGKTNDKYHFIKGPDRETIDSWRSAAAILTELGSTTVVESSLGSLVVPEGPAKVAIDTLLAGEKLPEIDVIISKIGEAESAQQDAVVASQKLLDEKEKADKEVERLAGELRDAAVRALAAPSVSVEIEGDGTIPDGKVVYKKASELFDVSLTQDFEVPSWEWDGVHPDVPKVDKHYIFRPESLVRTLYAIITNKRMYLQGHTGSGKTTLVEQVAAHLGYPFVRVNFDSEVTRMDLIGRDVLDVDSEGNTVSTFVDGMLPRAMSSPCILCCDEIDFVRPDVAYVMQAALEGNGLRITEDGDRLVKPHPMMRMFATGNTVGQGDEHGMYQGARPQSIALLDRFTVWARIDYLKAEERTDLVKRHFPMMKKADQNTLAQYIKEHLVAFEKGDIVQPISPRGMLAVAEATVMFGDIKEALQMTVLDKANKEDYATLKGLVDRVTR